MKLKHIEIISLIIAIFLLSSCKEQKIKPLELPRKNSTSSLEVAKFITEIITENLGISRDEFLKLNNNPTSLLVNEIHYFYMIRGICFTASYSFTSNEQLASVGFYFFTDVTDKGFEEGYNLRDNIIKQFREKSFEQTGEYQPDDPISSPSDIAKGFLTYLS